MDGTTAVEQSRPVELGESSERSVASPKSPNNNARATIIMSVSSSSGPPTKVLTNKTSSHVVVVATKAAATGSETSSEEVDLVDEPDAAARNVVTASSLGGASTTAIHSTNNSPSLTSGKDDGWSSGVEHCVDEDDPSRAPLYRGLQGWVEINPHSLLAMLCSHGESIPLPGEETTLVVTEPVTVVVAPSGTSTTSSSKLRKLSKKGDPRQTKTARTKGKLKRKGTASSKVNWTAKWEAGTMKAKTWKQGTELLSKPAKTTSSTKGSTASHSGATTTSTSSSAVSRFKSAHIANIMNSAAEAKARVIKAAVKRSKRAQRRLPQRKADKDEFPITDITEADVLMGRGNHIVIFPGNQSYREIVRENREEYVNAGNKPIKGAIARRVVETVWNRGGRFLECDGRGERWKEADLDRVLDKTTQALREKRAWKEHRTGD